jgi:hypothetical protein
MLSCAGVLQADAEPFCKRPRYPRSQTQAGFFNGTTSAIRPFSIAAEIVAPIRVGCRPQRISM